MWDLISSLVVEHTKRGMTVTHGYPKRQVLLLDSDTRHAFLSQLRADIDIFTALKGGAFPGQQQMVARSVFQQTAVKQMIMCLEAEGWAATERSVALQ